MKTRSKNTGQTEQKDKNNKRRELIRKSKLSADEVVPERDEVPAKKFELSQSDYKELMEIKEQRAAKQRKLSRMFFSIGLATSLMIVNMAFNWKFYDDAVVDALKLTNTAEFEELVEVPPTEQPPPPPPMVLQQPKIVEVPDEEVLEEIEVNLDVEVTEEMAVEEVVFEIAEIEEEEVEEIFEIVEHRPEPVGGLAAFYKYVGENIRYPNQARNMHIEGRVFMKFVVDKHGKIGQVSVMKGIGGGCDEEAVRVLENAPDWIPGRQRGKEVSAYMMLPITFKLAK